jgi:signal transduction histidine kinase
LKFGRAEEAEPRRELIPLKPILQEVADGLGLPRDGAIGWTLEMDDNLQIDADHEHLFRVLSNLTRNAVQAIESQGEQAKGEVHVKAWRDGRRVFIEVADDGPGVPKSARANLFRAFQGQRKGGTGLGLVVAAELIAAHGGSLRLANSVRKGATFVIEMPDRGIELARSSKATPSPDLHDEDEDF